MALRYIAPALAVAGMAAAACSGTTTISNSADAAALSTCYTYSGDIAIATGTTDAIALDGIRRISGSLTAKNVPNMASLSGSDLSQIDDSFTLNVVSALSTLNFPSLYAVDTVDWTGLPVLGGLSFTRGLTMVNSLTVDNTNLESLDGINLETVDTLNIVNNNYLTSIEMPLTEVGTAMVINSNGDNTMVSFENLKWAYNISLANCKSINLDSLTTTNGSLGFYSNYFQSISLANLTIVGSAPSGGGGFAFVDNAKLTNISAPGLKAVGGGVTIANNTDLTTVDGLNRLTVVAGAIDMRGSFKNVQFPALSSVRGGFTLESDNDITSSCNKFKPLAAGRAPEIKGQFTCKGSLAHVQGTGSSNGGSSSSSGGGSSASSSGAANPIYISGATGVMGVIAAIFGML